MRALDARTGRLVPGPIVDPTEPDENMPGLPVTRTDMLAGTDVTMIDLTTFEARGSQALRLW